jgi:Zn-dependent peptidase ImmA (M78 family)
MTMMKQKTRRQIEDQIEELLEEHGITSAPIPVELIAKAEGLPIVETTMHADISGALIKSDSLRGIAVNAAQAPVRKRFTVAHELAHHILDHVAEDHLDWEFTILRRDGRSSEANDQNEIEANFFAASLLMPKRMLRKDVEKKMLYNGELGLDDSDVLTLAKKYNVSMNAMNYRLVNLGFLPMY